MTFHFISVLRVEISKTKSCNPFYNQGIKSLVTTPDSPNPLLVPLPQLAIGSTCYLLSPILVWPLGSKCFTSAYRFILWPVWGLCSYCQVAFHCIVQQNWLSHQLTSIEGIFCLKQLWLKVQTLLYRCFPMDIEISFTGGRWGNLGLQLLNICLVCM